MSIFMVSQVEEKGKGLSTIEREVLLPPVTKATQVEADTVPEETPRDRGDGERNEGLLLWGRVRQHHRQHVGVRLYGDCRQQHEPSHRIQLSNDLTHPFSLSPYLSLTLSHSLLLSISSRLSLIKSVVVVVVVVG